MATLAPLTFDEGKDTASSKKVHYEVRRSGNIIEFSVASPPEPALTLPVQAMVGGERHGLSFLLGVDQLGGIALERLAVMEARYGSLILALLFSLLDFAKICPLIGKTNWAGC